MANLHPVMKVYQVPVVVTVIVAVSVICGGELVVWIPIGFLGSPYERDCYETGVSRKSQSITPDHQFTIS